MDTTLEMRQGGVITLPAVFRERYKLKPGATLRLLDLGGALVLTPATTEVPELAREIERARLDAGLDMEEMFAGLRSQREQYCV
jgi:bifunctional DNA-binding transcriptional regulator/antitoxin component of YhaV-PrlF toxin-antitoxin module